ncbi:MULTISPECIES: HAD family hydrolase [Streptomyces]|uniref:HAD family hydrolase n=1 Tax=Streptomyces katrae TaxID=68223 RepID=A0ABT7GM93_9ACTN|nr:MULTISPECIES: HAD family hydrolase [Streptomyces]MDK9494474.1 HAD family hydrolase [Streptomyces katrae]RST02529.1 HAD family hydrolase [Streptomyces sp. WAC07149]GLX22259.1 hydrolase [Streptomyces lavendulae subsp. lavendulae]GLX26696.1 hydrolase [Streptomyces lavendulae subsp. lavendulae]
MPIRAVLWDIDDTLFDYTGADAAGLAAHLRDEGLGERYGSPHEALALWRRITELNWARFAAGEVTFQGQRRDRVRDFLGGPAMTDPQADAWFDRYVQHYQAAWALFPDVLPALDALAGTHRHGVLSNSSAANQDPKLRHLGLRDRFEVLVCAAELGVSKPDAAAFLAACEALALPPAQVAYVGDQPEIDARGARDAGLTAVWLDRQGGRGPGPAGVHRIEGLDRLPGVLAVDTRFGARSGIR